MNRTCHSIIIRSIILITIIFVKTTRAHIAHDHHHHHHDHHHECGDSTIPHEKLDKHKIYETINHNNNNNNNKYQRKLSSNNNNIRLKIMFDHYTNDKYMCTKVGQQVDPCESRGGTGNTCIKTCEAKDVVTKDIIKIATKRVNWAAAKTMALLKLTTSRSSAINVTKSELSYWDHYVGQLEKLNNVFESVDLVIIATLRKHNSNSVAGYAGCIKHDALKRCILGYFNYSPRIFNIQETNSPNVIEIERRTGLHEIFHVLGAVKLDHFHPSVSANTILQQSNDTFIVKYNTNLKKHTLHIKTPNVLKKWREQTNCNSSDGPTLEDLPSGSGSHWEARQFGSEVMSYGTLSGEAYLSDMTLAFLEDTGHYIVDYSLAGRLVMPTTPAPLKERESLFGAKARAATEEEKTNGAKTRGPGYIRWGREAGCDFFTGSISKWPGEYTCGTDGESGCSPDGKMSAKCFLRQYDATSPSSTTTTGQDTCYKEHGTKICSFSGGGQSVKPYIPTPYRWHGNSKDIGGWNPAMDYANVRIGVWNCADSKFSSSSTFTEGDMGNFDASDVFGSMESSIGTYGGQTLCPTCRCLKSSLRETSYGFDPTFTKKGLCYRVNCATPNDLQIGIKGFYDERWYNCPKDGGLLYISGFTGSLECPKASTFCKREIPTNEFKAVQDSTSEWIIWGFLTLLSIVAVSCWRFNHKFRNKIITFLENVHGTGDLWKLWQMALNDAKEHEFQQHPLRKNGRKIIKYASVCLSILAFYLLVIGLWSLRAFVIFFALAMFFIVYKGMLAFQEPHPGSNLMLYTYLQVALSVPSFIFAIAAFAVPDILATYVGAVNIPLLPQPLLDRLVFVGCLLMVLFLVCSIGYIGAVCMLGFTIASHSNLVIGNLILFFRRNTWHKSCRGMGRFIRFWKRTCWISSRCISYDK